MLRTRFFAHAPPLSPSWQPNLWATKKKKISAGGPDGPGPVPVYSDREQGGQRVGAEGQPSASVAVVQVQGVDGERGELHGAPPVYKRSTELVLCPPDPRGVLAHLYLFERD